MSNAIFPVLVGQSWNVVKQPEFSTKVHRSVNGFERRAAFMSYPLWTFKLSYEVLRDGNFGNDYDRLIGFIIARQGAFDSFLYSDPTDNAMTDQTIGIGDGSNVSFQLVRSLGVGNVFLEPVQNVNVITNITVDGSVVTNYTVNSTGMVTFVSPPAIGSVVRWSGTYYYRCRFVQDTSEFNLMVRDLWELKKLDFVGSTLNKV